MKDIDGIERPESADSHEFLVPQKNKELKLEKKKHFYSKNPIIRGWGYFLRLIIWLIFTPVFFLLYRLKVKGKKNLKQLKGKRAVLVMNHCHYLDIVMLAIKSLPRVTNVTSVAQNFLIPVAGTIIKWLSAIPIPYQFSKMRIFKEVIDDLLQNEKLVCFFPEAALWVHHREVRDFKPGAFRFAVNNDAPVVPIALTMDVHHKSLKKTRYRLQMTYFEPIVHNKEMDSLDAVIDLKNRAHLVVKNHVDSVRTEQTYSKRYYRQQKRQEKKINS